MVIKRGGKSYKLENLTECDLEFLGITKEEVEKLFGLEVVKKKPEKKAEKKAVKDAPKKAKGD
jgi:hypothetical protein